jgi:hypothetical protein
MSDTRPRLLTSPRRIGPLKLLLVQALIFLESFFRFGGLLASYSILKLGFIHLSFDFHHPGADLARCLS